jgi:hypothetical protein
LIRTNAAGSHQPKLVSAALAKNSSSIHDFVSPAHPEDAKQKCVKRFGGETKCHIVAPDACCILRHSA